jgi:hypothetical protein
MRAIPANRRIGRPRPRIEHMSESQQDQTLEKDPSDWVTGDEPATGAQKSYLETLTRGTDDEVPDELTKAEASQRIDELKES